MGDLGHSGVSLRLWPTSMMKKNSYVRCEKSVSDDGLAVIRYNAVLRPSGGTADAAVSKTVVERRAGSNPASGTT